MATISLYAAQTNQMPGLVSNVKGAVLNFQSELSALKTNTLKINQNICDLSSIVSSIQASSQTQEEKADSLDTFNQNMERFIEDTVRIDNEVADTVRQRKDNFYEQYHYLKPACEMNGWEKFCDGCAKTGEWCKEHWKLLVTIVIVIAAIVVIVFFPVLAPIMVAMAKGAIFGAVIGGVFGGIISVLTGGSFFKGLEEGAFGGAIAGIISGAMAFTFTGGKVGEILTLGQTLLIGAVSAASSALIGDLGDKFIKGSNIAWSQILLNTAFSALIGATFAGVFYGLSRAFTALRLRFSRSSDPNSGVVRFTTPGGRATPENIAQTKAYVKMCNEAAKEGALSSTGRVQTGGQLRRLASEAAKVERASAAAAGNPYQGHVGHVPDTTWTGTAQPYGWLDLNPSVNLSLGAQALKYPVGFKPTHFVFDSPLFNILKYPSTWSAPFNSVIREAIDK